MAAQHPGKIFRAPEKICVDSAAKLEILHRRLVSTAPYCSNFRPKENSYSAVANLATVPVVAVVVTVEWLSLA